MVQRHYDDTFECAEHGLAMKMSFLLNAGTSRGTAQRLQIRWGLAGKYTTHFVAIAILSKCDFALILRL